MEEFLYFGNNYVKRWGVLFCILLYLTFSISLRIIITKDTSISYCAAKWVKTSASACFRVHQAVGVEGPSKSEICNRNWWNCRRNCPRTKDLRKNLPVEEKIPIIFLPNWFSAISIIFINNYLFNASFNVSV